MAARPLVARQPNERLQSLIQELSWSNSGLARRVNVRGAEQGLDLRYDKTSVSRWLRGQMPRGRIPAIIAEVISRELGRKVTIDEIGMSGGRDPASRAGLQFATAVGDAVEEACELWRSDAGRRNPLVGAGIPPSALVEPSRDWLISSPDHTVARSGGPYVSVADVETLQASTRALAELDHRFGSGQLRPVAVHYLDSVISRLLTGSYTEAAGRQLFAAAARLTELAGYMAVDTGYPGLAQRYYIQALRLAQAAADRGLGGYVLAAGMSHLAARLGNLRECAQLARTAQEGARGRSLPTAQAIFYAAEARGHALLGDARATSVAAGKAVEALERGTTQEEPEWIAHFDQAYLADELAHCHRDLGQPRPAARCAEEALEGHPPTRVRRRAIDLLLLATAELQIREVDKACHTATRAVVLLDGLRSHLGAEYLSDFQRLLDPYRHVAAVRDFDSLLKEQDRVSRGWHSAAGPGVVPAPRGMGSRRQ